MPNDASLPKTPLENLVRGLAHALETGRILRIGPEEDPIVLCHRSRGEEIDDPDCADLFEAIEDGVFRRLPTVTFRDGVETRIGYRWLRYCPFDQASIARTFGPAIDAMPRLDREGIALNSAWIVVQHEDAVTRLKRRAAAEAQRSQRTRQRGY